MPHLRIQNYIAREVAAPTCMALVIFTFVLLMGRTLKLVEMVINKGVPILEVLKLLLYLLPSFLVITIPLSLLLGILLGFGRLSTDAELIALKSSGTSLYRMAVPVLLLALAASAALAFLTLYALPKGNFGFRNQVFSIVNNRASVGIVPRVFNDEFDGLVLYADRVDDRTSEMEGLFISDERSGDANTVILARTGRIVSDRQQLALTLRLEDGAIHRAPTDPERTDYQIVKFGIYDINLNMGEHLAANDKRSKRDREMTLAELRRAHREAAQPDQANAYLVELHNRLTLPVAPLIFALAGIPLGIRSNRSNRGGGFATALIVTLAYYATLAAAKTLGQEGYLPPALALWLPNLLGVTGGLLLLHRVAQERRPAFLDWMGEGFAIFRRLFKGRR